MGTLRYGPLPEIFALDDRTIAHLEIVTLAKLRRGEAFALGITKHGRRTTVWMSPAIPFAFELDAEAIPIDRGWLDQLIEAANTSQGLRLPD